MQPHECILEKWRHEGGDGPKGKPLPTMCICKSGTILGPGLPSTHLIELTEMASFKMIMYKSWGGERRLYGSQFLFSFPFLEILIINHLQYVDRWVSKSSRLFWWDGVETAFCGHWNKIIWFWSSTSSITSELQLELNRPDSENSRLHRVPLAWWLAEMPVSFT